MKEHPTAPSQRPRAWRQHLSFPGLLMPSIAQRIEEVEGETFSRFAIELVCFDLRIRRAHAVTSFIAHEPQAIQEAIDRAIVANYRPGMEHKGGLIRALVSDGKAAVPAATVQLPSVVNQSEWVFFPGRLREIINIRWQELGFLNLSQYVASVMRYDLLIGGQHKLFRGDDCTPEMLDSLDRETIREFHANRQPRTMADRIIEEAVGERLTREQCDVLLRTVGQRLREGAIEKFL
jgi:hypothetical protein